jgi:GNAT superfamily N-acetyltransferase
MAEQVLDRDVGEGLVARVVAVWRLIAAAPAAFASAGVQVETRAGSPLCPPGWVGVVRLRDGALAVGPDQAHQERLEPVLSKATAAQAVDPVWLREQLPVAELMGPAELGYADAATATLVLSAGVRQSTLDEPAVERLLARASAEDLMESGVGYVTSPMFVVRDGDQPVAVAGYRVWAGRFAHLSLLTDPERRGEGLGRKAASAAAAHALGEGLVLQWRARPVDSRAVGRALGFVEFGTQVSLRLEPDPG